MYYCLKAAHHCSAAAVHHSHKKRSGKIRYANMLVTIPKISSPVSKLDGILFIWKQQVRNTALLRPYIGKDTKFLSYCVTSFCK